VEATFIVTRGPVAIIDDDEGVLDSLRFLLEVAGYDVAVYLSAQEFLEDGADKPRCLILDHHMPRISGLDLAARLRARGDGVPVLLITGAPTPGIVARARQLGIAKVLAKPLAEDDLLGFVSEHAIGS
jgi:two-component system response regulator FixJ